MAQALRISPATPTLVGFGYTPVTGGLFLGADAQGALSNVGRFPVTQDQRNTFSASGTLQITKRVWGSFLGIRWKWAADGIRRNYPGRDSAVRPRDRESRGFRSGEGNSPLCPWVFRPVPISCTENNFRLQLQADAQNINNRLNVINFAGLFSGTGIAPTLAALLFV